MLFFLLIKVVYEFVFVFLNCWIWSKFINGVDNCLIIFYLLFCLLVDKKVIVLLSLFKFLVIFFVMLLIECVDVIGFDVFVIKFLCI